MNSKILISFNLIMKGEDSESVLKPLFYYCQKIAEVYAWSHSKVTEGNLYKWNLTIKDLIYESVSPLFIKNSRNKLTLLQSFENWESGVNDESEIDFFLHRVVWKSVNQRVMQLIKDSDPVFSKILKTVSIGISVNEYKKISYFGVVYIIPASNAEIDRPVISTEEFWKIPKDYFLKKQKNLLDGLIQYLTVNTVFFPAIPLNDLIKRIKQLYLSRDIRLVKSDSFEMIELKDVINRANQIVKNKIDDLYRRKDKLNGNEIDTIVRMFNGISSDLSDGGVNINLISYFEKYFPEFSKEEYYRKYQKILNYLYKIYRTEITSNLH